MNPIKISISTKEVVRLLTEWWLTTTEILVQNAGSEKALCSLKPYWDNAGRASAFNLKQMTGVVSNDVKSITALLMTQRDSDDFDWQLNAQGGKNSAIIEMICPYPMNQKPQKEVCLSICGYSAHGTIEALNPDFECDLIRSLSFGDPRCCWVIKRKEGTWLDGGEEKFEEIQPAKIVNDIFTNLAMAYLGEFWIFSTRAFLDQADNDQVSEILNAQMRSSGRSFGLSKKEDTMGEGKGVDIILQLIEGIEEANLKKGKAETTSEQTIEKEIIECPFSSAPPEICSQFESFFNGICEVIDPEYEFRYDRMMTKGERTCHWTIRKKAEPVKSKFNDDGHSDELTKNLAWRLSKGEISLEEFEGAISSLRKHRLLK